MLMLCIILVGWYVGAAGLRTTSTSAPGSIVISIAASLDR